jgi:hypothetical protein
LASSAPPNQSEASEASDDDGGVDELRDDKVQSAGQSDCAEKRRASEWCLRHNHGGDEDPGWVKAPCPGKVGVQRRSNRVKDSAKGARETDDALEDADARQARRSAEQEKREN